MRDRVRSGATQATRTDLLLETLALRDQLAVLRVGVGALAQLTVCYGCRCDACGLSSAKFCPRQSQAAEDPVCVLPLGQ